MELLRNCDEITAKMRSPEFLWIMKVRVCIAAIAKSCHMAARVVMYL